MIKSVPVTGQRRWYERVLNRFAALAPGDHRVDFPLDGTVVQFKARIVAGASQVLFNFHGAIDREKSKLPVFNGFLPELPGTHQIAISDPSLPAGRGFRLGWYAGHAGFNAQMRLPMALKGISAGLGATRSTYFGNSGGGFAALFCSHHAPGSIALVGNPQTNILRYATHLVALYREECWPGAAANEDLADVICVDLAALYAKGFKNTIIYCQSMGDRVHSVRHMQPFVGAIAGQSRADRLLLYSDFKGTYGHVNDRETYLDWARAIAASASDHPKDLLEAWHTVRSRRADAVREQQPGAMPPPPVAAPPVAAADLALTEQLRLYQQRQR